jgi:hypothetical protein
VDQRRSTCNTFIRPVDGIVVSRNVDGQTWRLAAGATLFLIAQDD